jgi:GT2 family glycosyltransferase
VTAFAKPGQIDYNAHKNARRDMNTLAAHNHQADLISIIIPTLGRENLYTLVRKLRRQKSTIPFEIVLIPQAPLRLDELAFPGVHIHLENPGLGYAYYRNCGIAHSQGAIIVFIDDDELPLADDWLERITRPILHDQEHAVTAGLRIPLGHGYLTDCISLLGFPGGGAAGFRTMWHVDPDGYTRHACTGNLAICRPALRLVQDFTSTCSSGNEDVDLAQKLTACGVHIRYDESATVWHAPRSGYANFARWNMVRGRSAAHYLTQSGARRHGKVRGRFASSARILRQNWMNRYFIGILLMMASQYVWQGWGFWLEKRSRAD